MARSEPLTRQTWKNIVALHWAVPGEALRPRLPARLTPALLDGHCRVTLSAFEIAEVEIASGLAIPKPPPFSQIEVRTYAQDESGAVGIWYSTIETERTPARVSRATVETLEETWLWSVGIRRPSSAALAHVIREEHVSIFAPEPSL